MPLYEYKCVKCNKQFTLLQSVNASEKDTKCPDCKGSVKKVVSSFSCSISSGFSGAGGSSFSGGG